MYDASETKFGGAPAGLIERTAARPGPLDMVPTSDLASVLGEISLELNYEPEELDSARRAMTLLKAPARRAAMALLAQAELRPEGELSHLLGYDREDLYHHLRVLLRAGILTKSPDSKYRTAPATMVAIRRYLDLLIVTSSRNCSGSQLR